MTTRGDKKQISGFSSSGNSAEIVRQFPEPKNDVKKLMLVLIWLALGDSFRARQLAEVLRILKRPSPVESEVYEGN